jgi:hypothetical protein
LSLFPVFSPCQAFKSVVQYRPHVSIHPNPHITLCTHAITSSPSSHPRFLRVWILVARLFAFVCHPTVTLSGSPATCAVLLWFASEISLCRHWICLCSYSVDMLLRQALSLPFIFLPRPKHILPAIPAITVTIIYASHRSKRVLPVSFALSLHITLPVLLLVVFPLFRSSDILIAMCFLFSFFSFFFLPAFTEH